MDDFINFIKSAFGFVTYVDYEKDDSTNEVTYTKNQVFSFAKLLANCGVSYLVARKMSSPRKKEII